MRRRQLLRLATTLPVVTLVTCGAYGRTMRERIEHIVAAWDAIGEHRTGTPNDDRTADWLTGAIEALGVEPQRETFDFERRVPGASHVSLDADRIDGLPCFDAPGTGPDGIRGRLAPLHADGEIGLLEFEPTGPGANALIEARRRTTHKALIAVCAGQSVAPGLAVINADDYATPFGPPVLQVATEHRDRLRAAADARRPLTLTAELTPLATTATNVGATIRGRDESLRPVVVMTPRSGWWVCTSERGGGLAAWLESMRQLANEPPLRTVQFTANTGHELGHVGLEHYLAAQDDLIREAHCWVHLGANFAAVDGAVLYQASDDRLMTLGGEQLTASGQPPNATTPVGTRPFGEARNVYDGGGRYVSILGTNPLFHHPDDRWPDAVDLDKTERVVAAMTRIAHVLANEPGRA